MSAPGRRAASRRILQELLSTHGTPVGPAAAPSPPRDIATPGHSPAIRSTPAGGEVISATSNPARLASSITGPRPASGSTSSQLMGVPLSRPMVDGDFHEPGHRIGVRSAFIWSHVSRLRYVVYRGNLRIAHIMLRHGPREPVPAFFRGESFFFPASLLDVEGPCDSSLSANRIVRKETRCEQDHPDRRILQPRGCNGSSGNAGIVGGHRSGDGGGGYSECRPLGVPQ